MNKRIFKFRGKDVFTDTWKYGDLVHNQRVTTTGLEPRTMVGGYEVDPLDNILASSIRTVRRYTRETYCGRMIFLLVL